MEVGEIVFEKTVVLVDAENPFTTRIMTVRISYVIRRNLSEIDLKF